MKIIRRTISVIALLVLGLATPTSAPGQPLIDKLDSPTPKRAVRSASPAVPGPAIWPLEPRPEVVRGFEPPPEPWLPGHRGVDLAAAPGQPVFAVLPGRVGFAGTVAGVPSVSVSHADGTTTTYQPVLSRVRAGTSVRGGQAIGVVTLVHSHCLPDACLHLGWRDGDGYRDPLRLFGRTTRFRLYWIEPSASPGR